MTHRERVIRTLNHEEVDRVPMDLGGVASTITDKTYFSLKDYLGITGREGEEIWEEWAVVAKVHPDILKQLDVDFMHIRMNPPKDWSPKRYPDGSFTNEWGTKWKKVGFYSEMVDFPLKNATIEDLNNYPWPDPHAPGRTDGLRKRVKYLYENTDYALATFDIGRLIEWCQWVRGFQQFMEDLVLNPDFVIKLMDKVLEIQKGFFEVLLDAVGDYIQVVTCGDDLGSQSGLLMSPQLYRDLIKPRHSKLFHFIKKRTQAKIFFHSDGAIYPLVPDLVEAGIDILNPVQPLAKGMSQRKVKEEFRDKLCFWGGVDTQKILPFGTREEVSFEVKRVIRTLGANGGLILSPAHNLQPDVPPENIVTLYRTAKECGRS